jgi:germination protein M
MKRYKWMQWIILGAVFSLILAGCGSNNESQPIDPPPTTVEEGEMNIISKETMAEPEEARQVTIYFEDANGYIAPVTMNLPPRIDVARQSLEFMVEGGPGESMLPEGFRTLLPKGTEVLGMHIEQEKKLAIVDFSEEFTSYNQQDERKMLEAITWTLTDFPTIDQVEIRVEGELLNEMPVGGTPLDEPLSRTMGVNLERAAGVNLSRSMPVTLYFQNQIDDYRYFIPVTRMIDYSDNVAMSAMEQLISGPIGGTSLAAVMLPDVEVLNIQQTDDLLTVNLSESILGMENKVAAETLQSAVLSLTETTGIAQVQFIINGEGQVSGTDNLNYSQPVNRPLHLNPLEL